jgi:SAM-dependent methyltransferase
VSDVPQRDHYSYTVYSDPVTARSFDDRRFGGPIGEIIAEDQARVIMDMVGCVQERRVLDVGTGTGRAALLLARAAAAVTAVDASDEMLAIARERAAAQGVHVRFQRGDAHALEFADRAFEVVVSLRVLMHAREWRSVIRELCRVADELVILDYPSRSSFALIQSGARRVMHAAGLRTEPYRVFGQREIARELARAGYRVRTVHRQFVLPIAVHKAIGSPRFTVFIEKVLARAGLLAPFGSPVTLAAERCASS